MQKINEALNLLKQGVDVYFLYDYEKIPYSDVLEMFRLSGVSLEHLTISARYPRKELGVVIRG
jgi:hypothetical protein